MLAKSDLIWFGSRVSLNMLSANALELQVGVDTIHPATSVRDLGVLLDSELTTSHHVSNVASCFFQLRRLRQDRHILSREVTALLISAFVLSRLDYCNSVLAGLPRSTTEPLQPFSEPSTPPHDLSLAYDRSTMLHRRTKQLRCLSTERRINKATQYVSD